MNNANIGDVVEEQEIDSDAEQISNPVIDRHLKETYVQNIKRDDNKKEDDIIED